MTFRCVDESLEMLLKHVPTQAETQVHRTAPCDDSSDLQVFHGFSEQRLRGDQSATGLHKDKSWRVAHRSGVWACLSIQLFGDKF